MAFQRSSGILLHPTSLPGKYGIGTLGQAAFDWIDWLTRAGQKLWQVLPLGHTGYGDSPYQCFSAFAGNPLLIDLEQLVAKGWLSQTTLEQAPDFSPDYIDYGQIYVWKWMILREAYQGFLKHATTADHELFDQFRQEESWLGDYALFMAIKEQRGGIPWNEWPEAQRNRREQSLRVLKRNLATQIGLYEFVQWVFFSQWASVRQYAHEHGIKIIGDIPIFVAMDSADVWVHQDLFYLNPDGKPQFVAGVPPDYFSKTGQLWGNPLYRWDRMAEDGFAWWLERIRATLNTVDIVRIDHFRGFETYWEIPGDAKDAVQGRWAHGPGASFLEAIAKAFPDMPVIAEDLGDVGPEVYALRDQFNLPGMKILQFGFYDGPDHAFLPHTYSEHCVVYTGTHDNDTTRGWYEAEPSDVQNHVRSYLHVDGSYMAWDLTRAAWHSRALLAVVPLQDILNLPASARMNTPGTLGGTNWAWRYRAGALDHGQAELLSTLTREAHR